MKTRTMVDDELAPRPITLTPREATAYRKAAENRLHTKIPVSPYEHGLYVAAGLHPPTD